MPEQRFIKETKQEGEPAYASCSERLTLSIEFSRLLAPNPLLHCQWGPRLDALTISQRKVERNHDS